MNTPRKQVGGTYSLAFTLGMVAILGFVGLKVVPIYLNEQKATTIVGQTASNPSNRESSIAVLRRSMQKRWDVDDVKYLKTKDVKLVKGKTGHALAYKYEVRTDLFANWALVLSFDKEFPMGG